MKKLFLLLTAITSMGYATTTMNFETGLSGKLFETEIKNPNESDRTQNKTVKLKEGKVPVSVSTTFQEFGFNLEGKLSNDVTLDYMGVKSVIDVLDTVASVKLGYKSDEFYKTTWKFDLNSSAKVTGKDFEFKLGTGFEHDFGLVKLNEGVEYNLKDLQLLGKVGLGVSIAKLDIESGYKFGKVDKNIILNGKLSSSLSKGIFTYSPYIKTDNIFTFNASKKLNLNSSKTEIDVVALTVKPGNFELGLNGLVFINIFEDSEKKAASKNEELLQKNIGLDADVKLAYTFKANDKVTVKPSLSTKFVLESTTGKVEVEDLTKYENNKYPKKHDANFTRTKQTDKEYLGFRLVPTVGLDVKQVVSDKVSLSYKFKADLTADFHVKDTTKNEFHNGISQSELSFGFGATYTF